MIKYLRFAEAVGGVAMPISAEKLKEIMPVTRRAATFAGPLAAAMAEAGIDTPRRAAMFLAQIAHEPAEIGRASCRERV